MSRFQNNRAMNRAGLALLAALFCAPAAAETIDSGNFGPVQVVVPPGVARGFAVLFSGADGWTAGDGEALAQLGQRGFIGAGIDLTAYAAHLATRMNGPHPLPCFSADNDVEGLSREVQRLHPVPAYFQPIVAGRGAGGLIAATALMQAKVNTIAGAISLDPVTRFAAPGPSCPPSGGGAANPSPDQPVLVKDLHGFWTVAFDGHETPDEKAATGRDQSGGVPLTLATVQGDHDLRALVPLLADHLAPLDTSKVAGLPLVELPSAQPSRTLVIIFSGDGGWRDIDRSIAAALQSKGVSVIGWDSLRYFWWKKSPERAAADLADVLTAYGAKWGADRIVLAGYSFGADVLPAIYDRLPSPIQDKVTLIALLGLESKADWEIQVTGWLGAPPSAAATPVGPELAKIPARLVQCYYGASEDDSACPSLLKPPAELIETKGGHHFGQDYALLAGDIFAGLKKRLSP